MTATRQPMVPAVGGTRQVPAPDQIAIDYILLGLRSDQHMPGLVDGYFGPADLKARVDMEQRRSPGRLRDDAVSLADRVQREVEDTDRREWLGGQLVALEAHARTLVGEPLPYVEYVERCMGFAPIRHDDERFHAAARELDRLLPGAGPLHERLAAWDRSLEIPTDRLAAVAAWLVDRFRERAVAAFGVPDGEALTITLVNDQPWGAYNWYDGGRRSRIDINTDLPTQAPNLILTVAHEAYPGHHLEHAWKEAELVDRLGRLEASLLLINTPESPVSEGIADYGTRLASPVDERADLLVELIERAGLPQAADQGVTQETAERAVALSEPRRVLRAIAGNAALHRHADRWSSEDVLAYLVDVGRFPDEVAAKRLEFIEHPLWKTYGFAYDQGESLVARWVETAEAPDQVGRFGTLLREPVTPRRLLAATG
jgi:hypothetical protein